MYKDGFKRNVYTGVYSCKVSPNTKAYSPVEGTVVAVGYYESLGNSIAVEFGDKVFIAAHLDEISVKVGEKISAGQSLGICGASGAVATGDAPMFSIIAMQKK